MSKYNLTELLSEVQGGRIGTLNITAMDLERKMEELEGEGIKVSTFDGDNFGKTYIEYHVHPENKYDPDESFSIYDYKFGEDPTDIDNVDKEYPFSIGGMSAALNSAKALLGAGQASYSIDEGEAVDLAIEASQKKAGIEEKEEKKLPMDETKEPVKEEEGFVEVHKDEIKMHLDQYRSGNIDGDDLAQAIEEIVFGRNSMEESSDKYVDEIGEGAMQPGEADLEAGVKGNMDAYTEGKGVDFIKALKVDANGTNLEIKSYLESLKRSGDKFDSVDDYVEDFKNYIADKALQEHFGRFMKDYQ